MGNFILGMFLGAALGVCSGAALEQGRFHDLAIQHNAGFYDPKTSSFVWRAIPPYEFQLPAGEK